MSNDQLLFTEKELMQRLRLSRPTLGRLRKRGALVPVKVGRSVRYTRTSVEAWLKALEQSRPDERHEAA